MRLIKQLDGPMRDENVEIYWRYFADISCIGGYTCRRNIGHLIFFSPNILEWPKTLISGLDIGLAQPNSHFPTSTTQQPNVHCTPTSHPPLQCLNNPFWCNELSMWDCKNWNFEKARENPRKWNLGDLNPNDLLIIPHQHQPTNQPCFIWQDVHILCIYICTLLTLNILTIYINKYYKLYTYIIN